MRITRFLLPGCLLAAFATPASAQFAKPAGSPYRDLIPSVQPAGAEEPAETGPMIPPIPPVPPSRRGATTSLEQITTSQPGAVEANDAMGTMLGQPPAMVPGLPPGSYPSPFYVDGPGCCGPMGRDGRIGYELYGFSGINFAFGPGLAARLDPGWTIGGAARTLFFDPTYTAAWTVDLGLSYTHNAASGIHDPVTLFIRQPPVDRVALSAIRGIHRTSFNFNFGRDVWLWGAGNTPGHGTNVRVGAWVGGRYGSAHVDITPLDEVNGYARRQNVFEGVVVGTHATFDMPMGGWILFGGLRAEYGYDWLNLVPPLQGNINNINLQVSLGVRF